ncbi:alpha/beta hydrolase [Vibrio sp. Of7-15]|uniref:alpha/beta fold hydrolase n=1 Tax=Vibrio sp. Of7-15 TaxID=2724879 RepID=UPI001EF3B6BE|nr:alpha/beta fold hydrolase [Vibrio sp. Of7-15]MCG7498578.1 alpha/beta hydrolase [Vibrio sp. Of7-15]
MFRSALAALLTVTLIGCNSDNSNGQTGAFVKNPDQTGEPGTAGGEVCPTNMECGFLSVPKDYANEHGEKVEVFYGVHKAQDPSNRIGILVFNFGGPSAEAVWGASGMVEHALPQEILNRFDIVGIDPRGAGKSAFAAELTQCAKAEYNKLGDCKATYAAVAPYLGSNSVVKDIDRLRAHLGEDKLNFLGYSYGTRLGSLYANTFPENVRAIVLDSPMSPDTGNYVELRIGNAAGHDVVAHYRVGNTRKAQLESVAEKIGTHGSYSSSDNQQISVVDGMVVLDILVSRDSSMAWSKMQKSLETFLDNDLAQDLRVELDRIYSDIDGNYKPSDDALRGQALFTAVVCTDESQPLTANDAYSKLPEFRAASRLYGEQAYRFSASTCTDWAPERDAIAPVTNMEQVLAGQNILVIGGKYDPATPYVWANEMVASFGSLASFITVDKKVNHGFSYSGLSCVDTPTTSYLLDPTKKVEDKICTDSASEVTLLAKDPDFTHPAKNVIGW